MTYSETKRTHSRTLFWFLFINLLLTLAISYQYILSALNISRIPGHLFANCAMISNYLLIYLVLAILLQILILFIHNTRIFFIISVFIVSVLQIISFIDMAIYRIFKFHINSMVLNLIFTDGSEDSLHFGAGTLLTFGIIVAGLLAFETILIFMLFNRFGHKTISKKIIVISICCMLFFVCTDKFSYAVSDLYNYKTITRLGNVFPLYQKLTIKHFMRRYFHFNTEGDDITRIHVKHSESGLHYPKKPLIKTTMNQYPNIIWIILDAWRYDMFNKELTPHIWEFSKTSTVCEQHYSGGNATRFGIFTLLYGIYGYYWHQFLAERQGPVFIDELINMKYDFLILGSANLVNPEFRKTAFVNVPDEYIFDRFKGSGAEEKDPQITEKFITWLNNRHLNQPFFTFLFYDAPHGPYRYPDTFDKYQPSNRNTNYLTVNKDDVVMLKNSYKNAIGFDDFETGKVLDALENSRILENTIVVITADHGEEFYESGFLGHTSAFSDQQTRVPLILYIPNKPPGHIDYMTSHLDMVPTMFDLLGYTSAPDIYSQGMSILNGKGHDFVVSSGWDNCAIINKDNFLIFSFEVYNLAAFEVRDKHYKLIDNDRDIINKNQERILLTLNGFNEYIK